MGEMRRGKGAVVVLKVNPDVAGGVSRGVGLSRVRLAAGEDDGVLAELELETGAAVLAGHAQARQRWKPGVCDAHHDADNTGVEAARCTSLRLGWWRLERTNRAALDFRRVVRHPYSLPADPPATALY